MTADTIGGVWTFAMEICRAFGTRGITVTLVTMGRMPDEAQQAQVSALDNVRLVPTGYPLEWRDNSQAGLEESGQFLLALAHEFEPDIVHSNTYYHAALNYGVPVLLTAHSCVSSWWQACKNSPLPAEWLHYDKLVSAASRSADAVVAPTSAYLDVFCSLHGHPKNARVIWNGRHECAPKYPAKENFVLGAGRLWDEGKNIRILGDIATRLEVPVLLAGDQVAPDGSLSSFTGARNFGRLNSQQLQHWMSRALIFASPARYEPFGLTVLEAALQHCALVLSDIASFRELWDGAAIFVHPDDQKGWRTALSSLSSHPPTAFALGRRAHERARRYSADTMAEGYIAAYRSILSGRWKPMGVAA